jgi:hypothetical protein
MGEGEGREQDREEEEPRSGGGPLGCVLKASFSLGPGQFGITQARSTRPSCAAGL